MCVSVPSVSLLRSPGRCRWLSSSGVRLPGVVSLRPTRRDQRRSPPANALIPMFRLYTPLRPSGAATPAAREIARSYPAEACQPGSEHKLVLTGEWEYPTCWMFGWNTVDYVTTGEPRYALAGNGAIIVNRRTAAVRLGVSGLPVEEQVDGAAAWAARAAALVRTWACRPTLRFRGSSIEWSRLSRRRTRCRRSAPSSIFGRGAISPSWIRRLRPEGCRLKRCGSGFGRRTAVGAFTQTARVIRKTSSAAT
jgi:hypothetical protein